MYSFGRHFENVVSFNSLSTDTFYVYSINYSYTVVNILYEYQTNMHSCVDL